MTRGQRKRKQRQARLYRLQEAQAVAPVVEETPVEETPVEETEEALLEQETAPEPEDAPLEEVGSMGLALESMLWRDLLYPVTEMLGDGRLARGEFQIVIASIGAAQDAFATAIAASAPQLYTRGRWESAPEEEPSVGLPETEKAQESARPRKISQQVAQPAALEGEIVALMESGIGDDGMLPIKIIEPGWGSMGYYPAEVLERDGPKVFKKGMHAYWNHPTKSEESERPERDLRDLAGLLETDAKFLKQGPDGPGLYAKAKVFAPYREAVKELAPHIGMSMRAVGRKKVGIAEGREGPIITELVKGRSVDFVTRAGAGGKATQLFESARGGNWPRVKQEVATPVQESSGQVESSEQGEQDMGDNAKLEERLNALEETVNQLKQENTTLAQANARLTEANLLRESATFVRSVLDEMASKGTALPALTMKRLVSQLAGNPVVKEGALDRDAFRAQIEEAAKAEMAYLMEAGGIGNGAIRGMGGEGGSPLGASAKPAKEALAEAESVLDEAFTELGMSDGSRKIAVRGR